MQYVVLAKDGSDADAPARRQQTRPVHLSAIEPFVEAGNVLAGGAFLDGEGTMIGSMLLVEFPTREALDEWLDNDPYVKNGVWHDVEVRPFRTAVGAWMPDAG